MKKLLLLLMQLLPLIVNAQDKISVVTLKNGTELRGVITSFDPLDALTIVVAGFESKIKMSDVARVEDLKDNKESGTINLTNINAINQSLGEKKLVVTDFADYPDSFDLKVGNSSIKMILVRGGEMNMGYDGRHSIAMDSEPVHKVKVTSFYISETFVTKAMVAQKPKKGYFSPYNWDKTITLVDKIAQLSGYPVRLPTEAEWEFAACSSVQYKIFGLCNKLEYCSDWFDKFSKIDTMVDPQGPKTGKKHVVRAYNGKHNKFNRSFFLPIDSKIDIFFRLVVKAKDLKK